MFKINIVETGPMRFLSYRLIGEYGIEETVSLVSRT